MSDAYSYDVIFFKIYIDLGGLGVVHRVTLTKRRKTSRTTANIVE